MNKFPRYTIFSIRSVIASLVARVILPVIYISPTFIARAAGKPLSHILPLPIFAVYITFKLAVFFYGFWLIFRSTNSLCYYRFPEKVKWLKIMIVGSNLLLPWLEIWHLLSWDRSAVMVVPALWQKDPTSHRFTDHLFLSLICFLRGLPKLDPEFLAARLRENEKICFLPGESTDENELRFAIPINEGMVTVIASAQRLYMFLIPETEIDFFKDGTSNWSISHGNDETALVFEKWFSPAWFSEKELIKDIEDAIDELKNNLKIS